MIAPLRRTRTASTETPPHSRPARLPWPALGFAMALGWMLLFAAEARAADAAPVFARVADVVITQKQYDEAYAMAARNKFYHGKPPEAEVAKLQREVGDSLVNDVLLLREATRRKLQPDRAAVQQQVEAYETRYGKSEMWQKNKATLLPPLKKKLEEASMLDQLQAVVRKVPAPSAVQVQAYYNQHKEKFTEPEQVRVSLILLKVDPSSPQAKWNAALEEGTAIVRRLRGGADFAQLAKVHSGDQSAGKGGDLGYLHQGMLPDPAQAAVDKLQPGGISDAFPMLEGVAVLRLEDRKPAKLNPLSAVQERAHDLLVRDLGDQAWSGLLARLRKETPAKIDESRFLPLAMAKPPATAAATQK
jgi:parvulin-like peptidyl-prolyl isomerase